MRVWSLSNSVVCGLLVALALRSACAADDTFKKSDSWITFLSHRTGDNLLYRMRPDGSECKAIFGGPIENAPGVADGMTLYREPHWTWQSPDGKKILLMHNEWTSSKFNRSDLVELDTKQIELGLTKAAPYQPWQRGIASSLQPVLGDAAAVAPHDREAKSEDSPKAIGQENGLGLWAIKPDGIGERFLTTGWSSDWR
jgi:hypothetical protein